MQKQNSFGASVIKIAVPVALQCMLQASFSIVDQVMVGTIGSVSVASAQTMRRRRIAVFPGTF